MTDWPKEIGFLLVSILLSAYLVPALPEVPQSGLLGVVRNPDVQLILATGILFITTRGLYGFGKQRLTSPDARTSQVYVSSNPPDTTFVSVQVKYLGVVWEGVYGASRRGSEPYVHVTDPRCPRCATDVESRTIKRFLVLNKEQWRCPSCGYETAKNGASDVVPRRSVERIIEREAFQEIEGILTNSDADVETTPYPPSDELEYELLSSTADEEEIRRRLSR
jgi:ribosomal protein L37AE/L43A